METTLAVDHIPVMSDAVVQWINPRAGGVYIDATLGLGGHSRALLHASQPDGRVLGLDRDPAALEKARSNLKDAEGRMQFMHAPFSELKAVCAELKLNEVDGVLADLGVSSIQLDDPARGFSFRQEGPIDMRMDPSIGETALELIARTPVERLADILFHYGEERKSRAIARRIIEAHQGGRLEHTTDLRKAVRSIVGPKRGSIDPVTRTFQALRIAVNRELDELETLMRDAPDILRLGGRLVIISFHSLEDRIVKQRARSDKRLQSLFRKPLQASEAERRANPRSRSAKLRAFERVGVLS